MSVFEHILCWGRLKNVEVDSIILHKLWYYSIHVSFDVLQQNEDCMQGYFNSIKPNKHHVQHFLNVLKLT